MSRHKYPGIHPDTANVIARLEWASRQMVSNPTQKKHRNVARLELVAIIARLQHESCQRYSRCPGCSGRWYVRLRKWFSGYAPRRRGKR